MVSARLVDCPDSEEDDGIGPLPDLMFADGEEPVGIRVLTYQSSSVMKRIFNSLDEDEIEIIKRSSFGKLIEIADKPVFFGRFARYILSRQLKTRKKHEVWFRFACNPVRFSLREFAIVTGLPCGKIPRKSKLKMKASIAEQPYWPALFGKVEVVTVNSVIKMLYRKTVKDQNIRIRYACLALLESVLLPTSLNMKISRDHVEAIEDLEGFFAFPWGRVAFDMLMVSIKERDEIGLSQNTIAVKGFALALQLVMVQAIPSLTAVVQDSFSSSESDSEDAEAEGRDIFYKKQTLNPAHARAEDKKTNVIVHSILQDDPNRPIDVDSVSWSDEVYDAKVENLVSRIKAGHSFERSSFKGGAAKVDVLRMQDALKAKSKSRKVKKLYSKKEDIDNSVIAGVVMEQVKPKLDVMENQLNVARTRMDAIENHCETVVHSQFVTLKEELLIIVKDLVTSMLKGHVEKGKGPINNTKTPSHGETIPLTQSSRGGGEHENTIRNVLDNISEYSTPPRSTRLSQDANNTPMSKDLAGDGIDIFDQGLHTFAQSATSENRTRQNLFHNSVENQSGKDVDAPSFSLGLTQEEQCQRDGTRLVVDGAVPQRLAENIVDGNSEEGQSSRRSKRQKTVPSRLHDNFHCGPHINSRVRESMKFIFGIENIPEMQRKYAKLAVLLDEHFVFNLGGLAVTEKDIRFLVERSRFFSAKVVDILVRLLRFHTLPKIASDGGMSSTFLDSKFAQTINRIYPKFLQSRKKESYVFPKVLRDIFPSTDGITNNPSRYYFPFNVKNKHWVGICFDAGCGIITVLDCNAKLYKDGAMEKILTPVVQMLPYVAKFASLPLGADPVIQCYDFGRPKSVSQIKNPNDSGLMSILLMATHALHGVDACKHITTDILDEEGKGAAIMSYEFKEEL